MNHHFNDYPLEEMEAKSRPIAPICNNLELESLLDSLGRLPTCTEKEKEEWLNKEIERNRMESWKRRLRKAGVPDVFYKACVGGGIERPRLIPGLSKAGTGTRFFCSPQKGKTFSACALLARELWRGGSGFYARARDTERELASFHPDLAIMRRLDQSHILVLDDFELLRTSPLASSNFISLFKKRNDFEFLTICISRIKSPFIQKIEHAIL